MDRWGTKAWESRAGSRWLEALFEKTSLAEHVEHTLRLPAVEYADDIRAAAAVIERLGHEGLWPRERLPRDVALAVFRLEEIHALGVIREPSVTADLRREIEVLRARSDSLAALESN